MAKEKEVLTEATEEYENERWPLLAMIFSIILFIAMCVLLFMAAGRRTTGIVLPQFDQNAVTGEVTEEMAGATWSELSDEAMPFTVGLMGQPANVPGGVLQIYFSNPAGNDSWLMIQVLDETGSRVLGSTGLIKPGQYIKEIGCQAGPGTVINLKIIGYEPDLYYSQGSITLETQVV